MVFRKQRRRTSATRVRLRLIKWESNDWGDAEMEQVVQVLPMCKQLEGLALGYSPQKYTEAAGRTLAQLLRSGAVPKLVKIGARVTALMTSEELNEACKARRIILTDDCELFQLTPDWIEQERIAQGL